MYMNAENTPLNKPVWSILVPVLFSALTVLSVPVNACIDPASQYAFEVVFNKPGVFYNLAILEELVVEGIVIKVGESTYVFTYEITLPVITEGSAVHPVFNLSIVNVTLRFLVVIYLERFSEGAPYVEGLSDQSSIEYYLGVRLEYPFPVEGEVKSLLEMYLGGIVETVINYIVRLGVLTGLDYSNIRVIASTARLGYAGWNNRLLYSKELEKWAPYSELVSSGLLKGVLYRGNACSFQLPQEVVEKATKTPPLLGTLIAMTQPAHLESPTPTTGAVTPITGQEHQTPTVNGLIVAVSLVAGVLAGLLVYFYVSRKY